MRVVIVGPGRRAHKLYFPWMLAHPESCRIVGFVGPAVSVAESRDVFPSLVSVPSAAPAQLGAATEEWAADLVILSSPDSVHLANLAQLESFPGVVLVEKPVISREDQVERLALAWAGVGRLRVAHNLRHIPGIDALRSELASASSIDFTCSLDFDHMASYFTRWHRRRAASGGLEVTKACHHLDLLNWFFRSPPSLVTGHLWTDPAFADLPGRSDIHSNVNARLEYPGGRVANYRLLPLGSSTSITIQAEIDGGWVVARIDRDGLSVVTSVRGSLDVRNHPPTVGSHGGADHAMLSSVLAGNAAGAPLEHAISAVATGFSITRSHRTRSTVAVPTPGGRHANY